ncbi:MAG: hypothetical protein ACYS9X_23635, partial [Planctomycetota bacterium]
MIARTGSAVGPVSRLVAVALLGGSFAGAALGSDDGLETSGSSWLAPCASAAFRKFVQAPASP